ncbi:hypothetical protein [Enterococcus sp. CSURQ0835]|uniref:hypothetical protein n=1 Tax=Enterococcus sp. CSURQ0835 TaxID=2681394 RepID=UPI00135C7CCC|nr:hypothetical protein [Enterococcus sp. CSURQ0835]
MTKNYHFGGYEIFFLTEATDVIRLSKVIMVAEKFKLVNEDSWSLRLQADSEVIIFLNVTSYQQLAKKYHRLIPLLTAKSKTKIYLLQQPLLDENTHEKFCALLQKNITYLQRKEALLVPQIISSSKNLAGYRENLGKQRTHHFLDYEIPQEEKKLARLELIKAKTILKRQRYEQLLQCFNLL